MRENFRQSLGVFVHFAFWTLIFGLVLGLIAGLGIVISQRPYWDIQHFLDRLSYFSILGGMAGFNIFIYLGLPTGIILGLVNVNRLQSFRWLPYVIVTFALLVFYGFWFRWLLDNVYYSYNFDSYELNNFWNVNNVAALALFGATAQIKLLNSKRKPKAKRGE